MTAPIAAGYGLFGGVMEVLGCDRCGEILAEIFTTPQDEATGATNG
jgi:hypothetical protein